MLRRLCRQLSKSYSSSIRYLDYVSLWSRYSIRPTKPRLRLCLEELETRLTPSVDLLHHAEALTATPDVSVLNSSKVSPSASPSGLPAGFSPQQISQAYGFNQIAFQNGTIKGDGSGQTIAIVDAYGDPTIAADLAAFDSTYGLAVPPSFTTVNQTGGSPLPSADTSWDIEQSLDVEWAHAMAPGANILLVEANSSSMTDLMTAVNYAANQPGVSVVSMSWGSSEWSGETSYDSGFTTPSGHNGVTFVASSGDSGSSGAPEYVSVSPNVLAVGGTQLSTDTSGNYLSETGWSGSGGGISSYESQPSYQQGVVTQTSTMRAVPDVAYDASSSSPYPIYDTSGYSGWIDVYGTSAGAPQWAALVAIADQGRALDGQATLDGATQTLPALYQLPSSDFHDITSGSNGDYSAGPGYDLVTGLGSPVANAVVSGLVSYGTQSPPPAPWVVTPASGTPSSVTGTATTLSVLGADNSGASSLTYTWSVLSEPSGAQTPTFSINGSNAAQNTTATFYDAGTYTFEATIADTSGLSTSSQATVVVDQTLSRIGISPNNVAVTDGHTQQFTATTKDQFGNYMSAQPAFTWTLTSGAGTIGSTGFYTAPSSGTGTATVQASTAGLTATTSVAFGTAPASLSNLTATVAATSQVNLSWVNNGNNATSIVVLRSTDGINWTTLATLAGAATSYSDTSVTAGTTCYYRVDAGNSFGNSPYRLVIAYTASGNVLTYNYTNGVLSTAALTNSSGTVLQTSIYNAQGQITSVLYANGNVLTYTYNGDGSKTATLKDSNGNPLDDYSYSAQGQLTAYDVYYSNGNVFQRFYASDGSSTATLKDSSGNPLDDYSYNAQGQLTAYDVYCSNGNVLYRVYASDGSSTATLTNSSSVLLDDYTYNAQGTVTAYDTYYSNGNVFHRVYALDGTSTATLKGSNSNPLDDYSYNAQGQLTAYDVYCSNGNVLYRVYASDGSSTATLKDSNNNLLDDYTYNAQGTVTAYDIYYSNGNVFHRVYALDGTSTATLKDSNSNLLDDYTYNAQGTVTAYDTYYSNGNVFHRVYASDGSSTATLANSSGTVLETYDYNAQGQLINETPGP